MPAARLNAFRRLDGKALVTSRSDRQFLPPPRSRNGNSCSCRRSSGDRSSDNGGQTRLRVLAARGARSFAGNLAPPGSEDAGKTGCAPHPRSRRPFAIRNAAYEHTGLAEASGLPCAMALRLIRDRPGDPALCDTIALGQLSPPLDLTPASGRRTQSTSPYARTRLHRKAVPGTATLVSRCLASIASHRTS